MRTVSLVRLVKKTKMTLSTRLKVVPLFFFATLFAMGGGFGGGMTVLGSETAETSAPYRAIRFRVDVTPEIGATMAYTPNDKVDAPIFVSGILLDDGTSRVVWCSSDFLYICGESYLTWQREIAATAECPPEHVFLHSVHQHDSMWVVPEYNPPAGAVDSAGRPIPLFTDPDYSEKTLKKVCDTIREEISANRWRPIQKVRTAENRVGGLGACRPLIDENGKCVAIRWTMAIDRETQAWPTGTIDPILRTIAFETPDGQIFVALHFYATHPQVAYMRRMISPDAPGYAVQYAIDRTPETLHVYFTGCGGNVTFGKYNPSADAAAIAVIGTRLGEYLLKNLSLLQDRENGPIRVVSIPVEIPFNQEIINAERFLNDDSRLKYEWLYRQRTLELWKTATLSRMDIGAVHALSMGLSEVSVEYQLYAQDLVPEQFLATAAYANGIYQYMPLAKAFDEGSYEAKDRECVVTPEIEPVLKKGIRNALADLIENTGWVGAVEK